MDIVKVKNLSKVYGKEAAAVHALNDVSFSVAAGEFVAIVGASGSGKSTLLHMLGGVEKPSSGDVIIEGRNLYEMREKERAAFRRDRIGFIYQFFNLIPVLTVSENIILPFSLADIRPEQKLLDRMLALLDLREKADVLPQQLSGGQQQRVAVGRAMIHQPAVLLADEPTGNLDTTNGERVMDLFREANRAGQTIILITHDMQVASAAGRIINISDGRIVSDVLQPAAGKAVDHESRC